MPSFWTARKLPLTGRPGRGVSQHWMPNGKGAIVPGPGFDGHHYIQKGLAVTWAKHWPILEKRMIAYLKGSGIREFSFKGGSSLTKFGVAHGYRSGAYAARVSGLRGGVWNNIPESATKTQELIHNLLTATMEQVGREAKFEAIKILRSSVKGTETWGKKKKPPITSRHIGEWTSGANKKFRLSGDDMPYMYEVRLFPIGQKAGAQEYGLRGMARKRDY